MNTQIENFNPVDMLFLYTKKVLKSSLYLIISQYQIHNF
jgi:hypothetical protein